MNPFKQMVSGENVWSGSLFKKLTDKAFGIPIPITRVNISEINRPLYSSSWDNRHLLSATIGYKFHWLGIGIKIQIPGELLYSI